MTKIKSNQVWKAIKDYCIIEPYSDQRGCVIPSGTRIIVLQDPPPGAEALHIMPLSSKGIDERLIPNMKKIFDQKTGFGVLLSKKNFLEYFELDINQIMSFDNQEIEKFWKTFCRN